MLRIRVAGSSLLVAACLSRGSLMGKDSTPPLSCRVQPETQNPFHYTADPRRFRV